MAPLGAIAGAIMFNYNPLDSLRQQLQNQLTSLNQQLNELQRFEQTPLNPYRSNEVQLGDMVRQEVDRYLNERNSNQQNPLQGEQQKSNPLSLIINSIENQLSKEDLEFLMSNAANIPAFFDSKEGNKIILGFINAYKKNVLSTVNQRTNQTEE